MKNELNYWLALLHAPQLGPVAFLKLVEVFPRLNELFALSWQELIDQGITPALAAYLQNPDWESVEQDLKWAEKPLNYLLTWQDPAYPKLLKEIPSAPPVIYIQGNVEALALPQLAIVGSRNPTPAGNESAYQFARLFVKSGLTITSGLALGIDAAAHRGALAGEGITIGVMGTGLNKIYPTRHHELARKIIEQNGALVSEFPPDTLPKAENFPRRNRLISGLSIGVLVVEAALKSGSLITARYALEQGREVFAIPGSIHNPLARGCHALLRQGAKLVETAEDVLEELGALLQTHNSSVALRSTEATFKGIGLDLKPIDADHAKLIEYIGFEATPVDTLIERSGLPPETVSSMLMMLEIQGYVIAVPGGYARNKVMML